MDVLPSLITGGIVTAILGAMVALVRISVGAERRRADDWRQAAETSREANTVLANHVEKLIGSVEQLATSQREIISLLQTVAAERRSAA